MNFLSLIFLFLGEYFASNVCSFVSWIPVKSIMAQCGNFVQRLGEISPKLAKEECSTALLKGNVKKNRKKNIYPGQPLTVYLYRSGHMLTS